MKSENTLKNCFSNLMVHLMSRWFEKVIPLLIFNHENYIVFLVS